MTDSDRARTMRMLSGTGEPFEAVEVVMNEDNNKMITELIAERDFLLDMLYRRGDEVARAYVKIQYRDFVPSDKPTIIVPNEGKWYNSDNVFLLGFVITLFVFLVFISK